jgi:hypothetical protein
VILDRLNRRLRNGKYSDITIGAVSCLAFCENVAGNHERWKMHATGMSEMIRIRGGFGAVKEAYHMKIHKSDLTGAFDTLTPSNLDRPTHKSASLFSTLALEPPNPSIEPLLVDLGLTDKVLKAMVELSYLCHALNHAADQQVPIDPSPFDEDVTCIQHDLLASLSASQESVERLCVITTLIAIQPLVREIPFTPMSASHVSKQLKEAFLAVNVARTPPRLIFWMLFMGGLVSAPTNERIWFRKRLRDFQKLRSDLVDWPNVQAQLQKAFWVDKVHDPFGMVLWHDVENLNNDPSP